MAKSKGAHENVSAEKSKKNLGKTESRKKVRDARSAKSSSTKASAEKPALDGDANSNAPTKWTIFYSWQSDIPRARGSTLVRHALQQAAIDVEALLGDSVRIEVDEATRNVPGSPDILTTLLEKISAADMFIGDLTIVNSIDSRTYPNPNVLFETGYAWALLGWERTLMVANESYGELKSLPFDIPRRRVTAFKCPPEVKESKVDADALSSAKGQLRSLLKEALLGVIKSAPRKPVVRVVDAAAVQRQRDVQTLRRYMVCLNPDIIDELMDTAPARLSMRMFVFWESFNSLFNAVSTHVYDAVARRLLSEVHEHWLGVVSNAEHYMGGNGDFYNWVLPNDLHPNAASDRAFTAATQSLAALFKAQTQLRSHIREHYLELDEQELRVESWRQYDRAGQN